MDLEEHAWRTLIAVLLSAVLVVTILRWIDIDAKPKWVENNTVEARANPFFIETIERYPMSVEVVNSTEKISLGVVVDSEVFKFGRITLGTQSRKLITLTNPTNKYAKIWIFAFGNISNFTHTGSWYLNWTDTWEYVLEPNSNLTIQVGVEGREEGNFTGELVIVSRIPKFPLSWVVRWM